MFVGGVDAVHVVAERHVGQSQRQTSTARKTIPAVVVLTRTSPETVGRQRETLRAGPTAPGRLRFRSSQSLDQLLHQAEQSEDRHGQHDEHQDTHLVSVRWNCGRYPGLISGGVRGALGVEDQPEIRPASRVSASALTLSLRPSVAPLRPSFVRGMLSRAGAAVSHVRSSELGAKNTASPGEIHCGRARAVAPRAPVVPAARPRAGHLHRRRPAARRHHRRHASYPQSDVRVAHRGCHADRRRAGVPAGHGARPGGRRVL